MRLTGEDQQRLARVAPRNADAYRLHLQGRYWFTRRTEENVRKSAEYFQQAIEKDPGYARSDPGFRSMLKRMGLSP